MTHAELLARIDSRELTEWQAYERVAGPVGPERLDQLFAMLMATIANVNRGKRQRPYEPKQFLPRWDPHALPERKPEMDGHDMLRTIKAYNKRMGGRTRGGDAS